tara:strand:+ start:160 stop:471 length:312 start_codon:yes stop_codon:yes gene_type:complete
MSKKQTYRPLPNMVTIKESGIEGLGLFATRDLTSPLELGITHVEDKNFVNGLIRTPLGGFINHSATPNCELVNHLGNKYLRVIKDIEAGEELTLTYDIYDPEK